MSVGNWCDQCGRSHSKERPLYCNECHAAFQPSAASGRELPPLPYACHAGDFIDEMVVYTNDQMRERDAMWMERIAALTGAAQQEAAGAELTFDQIEDALPETGIFSSEDGYIKVTAKALHDFARNIRSLPSPAPQAAVPTKSKKDGK